MEVENFASQLRQKLSAKTEDSPTHRKAEGILQSLMHAAQTIPNFANTIANNTRTLALYLTAGTYKLLKKMIEGDHKHEHQLDAYLLLLSLTLPEASPDALVQGGLLRELRKYMLIVLTRKDNTPLMMRLGVSILSHSFAPEMTTTNFRVGEQRDILLYLFDKSVTTPRNNALTRECSRLLTHLLKNNSSVSVAIAEQSKANLLSSLEERKTLYLSNVKQVMIELPVRLLNDICHRVAANLAELDPADPSQQILLAQTYFFLEKMVSKLLASTLQDMILVLVNAVPVGTMAEKVQLSYLQLLYEATLALVHINEDACNRILSPVISVLIEMLLTGSKIAKFATSQFNFVLNNCIRSSLWRKRAEQLSLEGINLEENGREFTKIICLFEGLLSSRFPNQRLAANLLSQFFTQLEEDALSESLTLIHKTVTNKNELEEKGFKKVMEAIILAFGIENIVNLYPLTIEGDIAQEQFEDQNNLWMLSCIQKTDRAEKMSVYNNYLLPLLQRARQASESQSLTKQRRQAYGLVEQLIWRCVKPFTKVVDHGVNYEQVFVLINNELSKVSESTLIQLTLALEQLANLLAPLKYKSKGAEQVIKTLATILNITSGSASNVLKAIQALSKIAPQEYVKRVFDKNIEKLIGLAEEGSLSKEEDKNLKNLQILMSVNVALDLTDPTVATKYRISREELLLRLVSCLINFSGTYQKKGYKYLSETLSAAPKSLYLEVIELFQSSTKVESGSKYHRLVVIGKLWSWLNAGGVEQNLEKLITFIKNHLPEILLSLREQNKGTRQESIRLISEFGESMEGLGLLDNFIETVCAGLVGERSEMKLATLTGLSFIIGKGHSSQETFKEVLQIALLLLQEKRQELYKGVVQFCKRGLLTLPVDHQKQYLPSIVQMLFEADEEGKMEHRSVLRHFLIKMTKKHGRDAIEQVIPQQHRKMLSHALKMENREKRKKRQQNIARMKQRRLQNKQQKAGVEGDSSQTQEEYEAQPQEGEDHMDIEQPLEELDNTNNLLLKYDLEKERFHFQQELRSKTPIQSKVHKTTDQITFDERGIMIIEERKRARNVHQDDEAEEDPNKKSDQPANFKQKQKVQIHQVKQSGDAYRSNRAGGDVKLKDRPEPYAFIQFNSKALNKRFKKRAEQVFDSLFEKKEGGLRGLKSRIIKGH